METKDKGQETQDKGTEEKTYTQIEHDGVIKDLQGERTKRQDSEFKFSQSQAQLESLTKENEELKRKAEDKETKRSVIEGEDEDVLTKRDGRNIEAKVMTSIEKAQKLVKERDVKEKEKEKKDVLETKYQKSLTAARTKYADREDIGLDFEKVRQAALRRIAGRQYKQMDIYTSDNPGEELYKEGLEDPEIKEKVELLKNEKILDNMGNRKVDKKGLTGETKQYGFKYYTPDEVAVMKPEEALKVKPDIDKSMEKW